MNKTLKLTFLLGSLTLATNLAAIAGPAPGNWPRNYPTVVKTKEQALECCVPKQNVALACKDCKTVQAKSGEDKKGIMSWFKPDSTHDCSGCRGTITVHRPPGGKSSGYATYEHVCSKCGPKSAYTCATHKS